VYLSDPTAGNIILRCSMKDRKGDWVWADIPPKCWATIISVNGPEVGVFERFPRVSEYEFVHGRVVFVIGERRKMERLRGRMSNSVGLNPR
jgi:hypothetical protein